MPVNADRGMRHTRLSIRATGCKISYAQWQVHDFLAFNRLIAWGERKSYGDQSWRSTFSNSQLRVARILLMPQGFNRIHSGCHDGGVEAESDSDHAADNKAADNRPGGDVGGIASAA